MPWCGNFPSLSFAGPTYGSVRREQMDNRTFEMVRAGLHCDLRISVATGNNRDMTKRGW
jgi:hypothetical protein